MATVKSRLDLLRASLDHAFAVSAWHVEGLTEAEFQSTPTDDAWRVVPREDAGPGACGCGAWVIENPWPAPEPLPTTSISWRLCHVCGWTDVYRDCTFGAGTLHYWDLDFPSNAAAATKWLTDSQAEFRAALEALTDADLDEHRPTHWGGEASIGALVWTIASEHLAHGTEIGVLRDVMRGHARAERLPEPIDFWPA